MYSRIQRLVLIAFGAGVILAFAATSPTLAQTPPADPIQEQFTQAMQALEGGRVDEAIPVLSVLVARTDAPRIRLELARALYFRGRLKEARAQFLKVYARGDLPYAVRRTINVFLSDIDQRAGYFQPSLGLAFDSNPNQTPPSGVYDIFGIPLEYKSPAKTETGLRVEASGAAPIGRTGFSLIGAASVTRFADPDLGQLTAQGGVRRLDTGRRGYWGAGATYYERKGFDPASTVYLERVRRVTLPDQSRQLVARAAVSRITVRHQPQLDGWGLDGGLDYGFDLNPNAAVNLSASAGTTSAKYAVDRRQYGGLGAGLTAAMPRWNKTVSLNATAGRTVYGDTDPFFGKRRDDQSYSAEVRLLNGRPFHGLFPSVSVTWEQRASSIAFFNYERTGFSVGLQRRF